jgi:hypothetical protein
MPITYEPIATTTTTSNATTVTFSSIPATYTDIVLICAYGSSSPGNNAPYIEYNSDAYTNNNYSSTRLRGNGTTASSSRRNNDPFYITDGILPAGGVNETLSVINIMNYSNTTTYKTTLLRNNQAASGTEALAALWDKTEAISTITLKNLSTYYFINGSTFTLYGIKAA